MNTILILSSILFLWFIWSTIWVNVLNDFTKAQLIKLERDTELWFTEKGYGSNHIAYKQIQKEIESFISSVEDFSLFSYICFYVYLKKINKTSKQPDENNFESEIQDKIMNIRKTVSAYIIWKMFLSNVITFVLFFISFAVLLFIKVCCLVKDLIIGKCRITFQHFSTSLIHGFLFTIFIGIISLPFISKTTMQGYSDCIIIKNIYKQKTV